MDDIRDKMPMPPCIKCGAGICEKSNLNGSYFCPACGQTYLVAWVEGPSEEVCRKTAPLILQWRLTNSHWMGAMESAISSLEHEKGMKALAAYKEWLDEVGVPILDYVRQIKMCDESNPLPEGEFELPEEWR